MIILNRHTSSLFSTFGVILSGNRVLCHTLELPWRHNAQEISCIPAGDYPVVLSNSNRFGPVFRLKDVPGREGILIHVGNYLHETRGCILPGLDCDDHCVVHSRLAMDRLFSFLPETFTLKIVGGS